MTTLYFEQQKTYFLVVLVFILAAAVLLALVLWPGRPYSQLSKFLLLFITVLDLLLFWSFSQLTIKITDEFLQLSFGLFKKTLNFSAIKDVAVADYDKFNYFGYGIRLGKDKSIGYVARAGRGVKLSLESKVYFFSSANPEQIQAILRQKISKNYVKE